MMVGTRPLLLESVGGLCHAQDGFIKWLEVVPVGDGLP